MISVRFPSLKYNARRRFCYITLFSAEQARAATALNGKAINGQNQLQVLIADPDAKKARSGAVSEGRELHVANVEFHASEREISELFSQYGTVETIRTIKNGQGKFFGTCFVVFSKPEEAAAGVALNNTPFKDRLLRVSLASDKSSLAKQATTKLINNPTDSANPDESQSAADANGRRGSVASTGSAGGAASELNSDQARTHRCTSQSS